MSNPKTILLSLPNSGATWLHRRISAAHPEWQSQPHFFNPLCNEEHEARLAPAFGCELLSCYLNIASGPSQVVSDAINATWAADTVDFTHDIFSPFKLASFMAVADCFVLLREREVVFTQAPAPVLLAYEHAWAALKLYGFDVKEGTTRAKAEQAWSLMRWNLETDAKIGGVPVIWWHRLMDDETLDQELRKLPNIDAVAVADEIRLRRPQLT